MNQYTNAIDDETETESEPELVDSRKARRLATSAARNHVDEHGHKDAPLTEGVQASSLTSLMTTLPIDIAALDGDGLIEAQESITNAFADLQDQLPPIDANQDEAGDDDEGGDEDGPEEEEEGSTNDDTTKHHEAWEKNLEAARRKTRLKEWFATRAHVFADERIAVAAKALSIDIDKRIHEFAVLENGRREMRLKFHLLEADFEDWLHNHERFLGTKFTFQKPWKHTSKSAVWHGYLHTDHYRCHRYGTPRKKLNARKQSGQDDAVDEDDAAYEEGADGGRATRDDVTEKGVNTSEEATLGKRKRSTKRTSIRVGCHSRLACLLLDKDRPNGSPLRVYRIIYTFQHNHPIAKMDELGTQYLSQEQKDKIKRLLQEGSPVRVVLERMRANARKLAQHGKTRIFRDDIITYEDVYNVHHKIMAQEVHKDTDSEFSAHKWMTELENQGFYTCHETGVFYGFSSPWQLMQLRDFGKIFCFDGTHNVYGDKTQLYTIVVRNGETSYGVPVAFLLTRSTDQSVFKKWLGGLKMRMWEDFRIAFRPDVVVTDQGNVEILAIRAAFPMVRIQYCAWHVLRVWERRLTYSMLRINTNLPAEQRVAERDKVRQALHKILYTLNKDEACALLKAFQEDNHHRPEMLQFLDKNYFKETELQRWMICYRENIACPAIDTNNYVESWHNALKMYFLKDKQKRRADMVVYVLAKSVIPFYQYKLTTGRLQVGRMNPVQRAAADGRIKAEAYIGLHRSRGYSGQFVFASDDPAVLRVPSFQADPSDEARMYEVRLDFMRVSDIGEIIHCQCPQFHRFKTCCKHIALVILEKEPITFYHSPAQWTQQDDAPAHTEVDDAGAGLLGSLPTSKPEVVKDSCVDLIQRLSRLELDEEHVTHLIEFVERCEINCPRKDVDNWRRKRDRQQKY